MIIKRIEWRDFGSNETHAYNDENDCLGILKYERVGRHKHFCWYQMPDIRMSPGCLQEVRDKQKELLNNKRCQDEIENM